MLPPFCTSLSALLTLSTLSEMLVDSVSIDCFALSPDGRSGLPRLPRSSFSCAVESSRSLAACLSEFWDRFPPVTDWLAERSESVHVLIAEQTPSAHSCGGLVLSLELLPLPPQPAARTASASTDARAANSLIRPEASGRRGVRVMPK